MNFIIFAALIASVASKFLNKNELDFKNLPDVWESPELKPVLEKLLSKLKKKPKSYNNSRIFDGNYASSGQFPYFVFLEMDSSWSCGGSLIKPRWVLTVRYLYFFFYQSIIFFLLCSTVFLTNF